MHGAQSSSLWVPEGADITTEAKPNLQLPSRTWIITEKLEELSFFMMQQDIDDGHKPGFAAAKFLCHPFRASQAIPQKSNRELVAFKTLKHLACPVVPQLLAYQQGTQGDNQIVPGGYEISIIWEKVPGEPLSQDYFWSLNEQQRDSIREEFRRVYQQLLRCDFKPCMATSSKLIYDESTGKIHMSRFRMAAPCDTNQQFRKADYVMYRLAKRSDRRDWYNDDSGWKW